MRTVHLKRRRQAAVTVLGLAVLAAGGASCSSGSSSSSKAASSTTTSATPTTSTTMPPPGSDAVAAYRAFWDDFLAAGNPAEPESPRLAAHTTGDQLAAVRNHFLAIKAAGQVIRGGMNLAPRVVSVEATTVVVSDCYDDQTGLYSPDGVRQDKEDPRRHLITATVTLVSGVWKVASVKHEGDGCTAS